MATPVYLQFAVSDRANLNTNFCLALSAFYIVTHLTVIHMTIFSCVLAQTPNGAKHKGEFIHLFFWVTMWRAQYSDPSKSIFFSPNLANLIASPTKLSGHNGKFPTSRGARTVVLEKRRKGEWNRISNVLRQILAYGTAVITTNPDRCFRHRILNVSIKGANVVSGGNEPTNRIHRIAQKVRIIVA